MDKQQAQNIIKETFENSFDKRNFTGFIKNLLNQIEDTPLTYQGNYIPDAYKQYIKTLERIGKFSDGENSLDILVITLQKETSLERARTMQRNFIAWYLNGSRGGVLKDAALAAFVSPGGEDWRFSLVKMDYKFEKIKTGKVKVKEEFTSARRWSFLVGTNEKSHTAQSRLVNILANDEQAPTLEEIEKSFDIETVTKEFFLKYRELFLHSKEELDRIIKNDPKIKADFDDKGVDTVNFAKKLLGQIIFLYFLQKKGWFGVGRDDDWGTGSKHFLRELFEKKHSDYKNFYNDILEPLFYEALRIDRSHDDGYYSRFDCKIPFLNGGLFDPIGNYDWVHTDIIIPDQLFSNNVKTKEGDYGTGILDVFDRYNFTVREDEPLEKEVAIDPELLGKAYEKFNAIRPDNYHEFRKALKSGKKGEENKFNKKFGVYYTPREIVHYMCQQSLINYLTTESSSVIARSEATKQSQLPTKEDIETLIHTGEQVSEIEARVISEGRETRTYSHKLPEKIRSNAALIDEKLADITVCDPAVGSGAFPVGMMSEIVKARNVLTPFLSLRGAQATKQSQFDGNRAAYNFKRRCIEHSLYGVDIDPGAVEIAKLRLWLSLVVDEDDIKNIKPLPNLDYKIVCGNSLLGVEKDLFNAQLFSELEKLKPLFFNETNPTKKQEYKKQIDKLISEITSGHTEFDFEVYFSEVFHEKACPERSQRGGFDVVLANPPYVFGGNKGITVLEKMIFKELYFSGTKKVNLFAIFIERGTTLLKRSGFLTYITPNTLLRVTSYSNIREFLVKKTKVFEIVDLGVGVFDEVTASTIVISLMNEKPDENHIVSIKRNLSREDYNRKKQTSFVNTGFILDIFATQRDEMIISRLKDNSVKLGALAKYIRFGVVITKNKKEVVCGQKRDLRWKPFLEGDELGAYSIHYSGRYLCYQKELLHRSRTPEIFESRKIMIQRITGGKRPIKAAYDDGKFYNKESIINLILLSDDEIEYKYTLGFINSTLMNWLYNKLFTNESKLTVNLSKEYLSELPIKKISRKNKKCVVNIIDRILTITKDTDYLQNPQKQARVKTLEREIDQMVYKIYGLTEEEIKLVEGK